LELRRELLVVILFVMLSGDFGPPIMKGISILKWRMNLSFSKRKSSKDLMKEMCLKLLLCPGLEQLSIQNYTKNTMGTYKTKVQSRDRKIIHKSVNRSQEKALK
jgi:hypothetical protein